MLKLLVKFFPQLVILMALSPVVKAFAVGKIPQMYDYIVYISIALTAVWYYWANYKKIDRENKLLSFLYKILIIYVIVGNIKTFFIPSGLFTFFKLNICTAFLSFGSIFLFRYEPQMIRDVVKLWWKVIPIIFCLTYWKIEISQYIVILYFCLLFLVFLPFFSKARKILIIAFLLFVVFNGIQQRIDFLNIILPLLLYSFVKIGQKWSRNVYKYLYHVLMLLPIFFLLCFFTKGFNVLDMNSYIHENIESKSAGNMTEDTRSFLYEEAYESALVNHYLWFGRTPCYGYDSYWVADREGESLTVGKTAQRASEVFIVNMLTWTGLLGCISFFLLYYVIGLKTLSSARNNLLSILSLYIAMFWIISWISHNMFTPSLDFMILYIVIAICINRQCQKMNNEQMCVVLKRLFV